jgi:ATP-binding cassette subfamily B protein
MIGGRGPIRLRFDDSVTRQQIKPGTVRRILPYALRYRWALVLLLSVTTLDAVITVANPLILRLVIDNGILPRRPAVVAGLSLTIVGLALVDALAMYTETWSSARIGEGLVYDLRNTVFRHVQQQPLAFFTRAQTGSLVSRLNTDIIGAQQAVTSLLSQAVSAALTLALVLAAMFYLSWQITVPALVLVPLFLFPGRLIGKKLQRTAREGMQLDSEIGSMMNERFNVAGAMLTKLYGHPDKESGQFANRAGRVRDIAIITTLYGRALFIVITVIAALITALVYGVGGSLVINGALQIGTLVALVALLTRLGLPISQISNMQVNVLTALVSFDRVFEVLDLKPLIAERPGARPAPSPAPGTGWAPEVEFDRVWFRYPAASEVSLASLESIALPMPERRGNAWTLREVSFRAAAGQMTALVGPSGAGKTTITHLVPRLYDPASGAVRIDGHDIRDLTLQSLRDTIGVVTQDAHLFHDTIRANLMYAAAAARPGQHR